MDGILNLVPTTIKRALQPVVCQESILIGDCGGLAGNRLH